MKIAILCVNVSGRGGMETVISHLVKQMNEENIDTKVFLTGGSSDDNWLKDLSHNKRDSHFDNKYFNYAKNALLLPFDIKKFDPDVIIGANPRAVQLGLYVRQILRLQIPVASWMHFSLPELSPLEVLKKADFHIAISNDIFHQYQDMGIADVDSVYLVNNPVVIHDEVMPKPMNHSHFVYVGRLIYDGQKRVNDLLHALENIRGDWKLTVIGDGQDKSRLMRLAEDLDITKHISWLGWIKNPWAALDDATALVLTSDYEGFGMVLIEAMSYGIPCISSDCTAGPAEIISSENGWLYPKRDVQSLSHILQTIVSGEMVLPDAQRVKQSIERFDVKEVSKEMIDVLECEMDKYLMLSEKRV